MVLDGLYGTKLTQDLHLKVMDTIVFKRGSAAYLCYNLPSGRVNILFKFKLLTPVVEKAQVRDTEAQIASPYSEYFL